MAAITAMGNAAAETALGAQPNWQQTRTIGINATWPTGPGNLRDNNSTPAYTQAYYATNSAQIQSQSVVRGPEAFVKPVTFPTMPPARYPDLTSMPGVIAPPEDTMRKLVAEQVLDNQVSDAPVPMDVDKESVPGPGARPFPEWNAGMDDLMAKAFGPARTNEIKPAFGTGVGNAGARGLGY